MNEIAVKTVDLVKIYKQDKIVALNKINIEIYSGEFLSIIGPSGSGKTTFLNIIGTLDKPTSGEVFLFGQPLNNCKNLDLLRARYIGFIFQLHNLIPSLTAMENVMLPMIAGEVKRRERKKRALELLEMVGLSKRTRAIPPHLSGGERQRVAIARALANNPKLILADEPTGNLDSVTGQQIIDLLINIKNQKNLTLVLVTHNINVAKSAGRTLQMIDGQLYPINII